MLALRVLVVDDCQDTTETMTTMLQAWGHSAYGARNGADALAVAFEQLPDVVLLDLAMPGMNGMDLARRLRELPGLEKVVLIMVSGYCQPSDRRRSEEAGCDLFLIKPVDLTDLRQLLAALEKSRLSPIS